jgi:exodeoxyribonuclease VII large subunit
VTASTAEEPWPVRTVAMKVAGWIDKLGSVWVEGQLTQINARPGTRTAFLVLRDPSADMSLSVTCSPQLLDRSPVPLSEGAQVILYGKLSFYTGRGTISLRATDIRAVGVGELLARVEKLRALLAAEGLFDPRLKRPLPFLPSRIGLITARASAAEKDVLTVAHRRWPAVQFVVRHTPVQGPTAVPAILDALKELEGNVDVIILARGGGSVEDLLPFSDEALCRAISRATTPIVSAIGHEPDSPLSDHVADLRAATPTDAAKLVVPDAVAEQNLVVELRARTAAALRNWVAREARGLEMIRHRPVLADPIAGLEHRREEIVRLVDAGRRDVLRELAKQDTLLEHLRARLQTLGPAATLARGYAVVQRMVAGGDPEVLRSVDDAPPGTQIRVRVADGAIAAAVMGKVR